MTRRHWVIRSRCFERTEGPRGVNEELFWDLSTLEGEGTVFVRDVVNLLLVMQHVLGGGGGEASTTTP
jgi:hypothetical protein